MTLAKALRIALMKSQEMGTKGMVYREMLSEADIGLFPRKLEQMYNLLKGLVGFDPLGRGAPSQEEEKPKPEREDNPKATSLQDLTRRIYDKAMAEPALRFQALYVHVPKLETLRKAYAMAKKNDGAPGIDGVTFEAIEESGVEKFLETIRDELVARKYFPMRNRKKEIQKDGGKKTRMLSIPSIRDRVVQGALKLILEPIFEADFQPGSYGYRPERTAHEAVNRVAKAIAEGKTQVIDLDLKAYFDNVRHHILMEKVARRIQDKDILHLLKLILKAAGKKGVPQGGVISPLLSNLYLNEVDTMLEKVKDHTREGEHTVVEYARYADDLVVAVRDRKTDAGWLQAIPKRLREEFVKIQVELNEEKSRIVDLTKGESFGFLGFDFRRVRSLKGRWRPNYAPKAKKRTALLKKLKETFRSMRSQPIERVVDKVNSILRGWVNYFRIGHSSRCFSYIRQHVELKIRRHLMRARKRKGFGWKRWSSKELFDKLGLFDDFRVKYFEPLAKALPNHAVT